MTSIESKEEIELLCPCMSVKFNVCHKAIQNGAAQYRAAGKVRSLGLNLHVYLFKESKRCRFDKLLYRACMTWIFDETRYDQSRLLINIT